MPKREIQTNLDPNTGLWQASVFWDVNMFTGNGETEQLAINAASESFQQWYGTVYPNKRYED